ncbi:tetraacyldisaccharide 4'-kinase [bacterium]|nr:tetraacyldisaccharide 4'-kinase [bacterium]
MPKSRDFRILLLPFSWIYGAIITLRNLFYSKEIFPQYKASVPIISVGNLTTGGTGKTPMAEYLLAYFKKNGLTVAYLSRGYGRKTKGYLEVIPGKGDSEVFGDEALQVARKFPDLPVAVCENRKTGIERLVRDHAIHGIVLDDAFQHRKVARDFDLIMVDANRLPQQDHLLPAGNLREPLRNLQRAHHVVVNKLLTPSDIPGIEDLFFKTGKPVSFCKPVWSGFYDFEGKKSPTQHPKAALIFSGIGNNAFFVRQAKEWGLDIVDTLFFPDHHAYHPADLDKIAALYRGYQKSTNFDSLIILTTEKDYCRLSNVNGDKLLTQLPFHFVRITLEWIQGNEQLSQSLATLFNKT